MWSPLIRAKKSLGQNFLIDEDALLDIAEAIPVEWHHIIEVWPGYGALTKHLVAQNPSRLDLVELDTDMIPILEKEFPKTAIHHKDILQFDPPHEQYSIIANIPYYITSPILFRFLYDVPTPPDAMVIMMQKEVWEKILAGRTRKPHHSLISLAMEQACEDIEAIRYVGSECFRPAPKVDSIVLRFVTKKGRDRTEEAVLLELWKKAFAQPRKTLISNLRGHYHENTLRTWLIEYGYDERVRAEAIKREDWNQLVQELY